MPIVSCHGVDGKATTPVALFRGGVVPIDAILADPTITDGFFHKITYGGIGDLGCLLLVIPLQKQKDGI